MPYIINTTEYAKVAVDADWNLVQWLWAFLKAESTDRLHETTNN